MELLAWCTALVVSNLLSYRLGKSSGALQIKSKELEAIVEAEKLNEDIENSVSKLSDSELDASLQDYIRK